MSKKSFNVSHSTKDKWIPVHKGSDVEYGATIHLNLNKKTKVVITQKGPGKVKFKESEGVFGPEKPGDKSDVKFIVWGVEAPKSDQETPKHADDSSTVPTYGMSATTIIISFPNEKDHTGAAYPPIELKVVVAKSLDVACYFVNTASSGETNAFRQRAKELDGIIIRALYGQDLVKALEPIKVMRRLDIHSHQWSGGRAGLYGTSSKHAKGMLTGIYLLPKKTSAYFIANISTVKGLHPEHASLLDLAKAIGSCILDDGEVNFYGCDSHDLAHVISYYLTKLYGKPDVICRGTYKKINPVQKKRGKYKADIGLKNKVSTYKGGKLLKTTGVGTVYSFSSTK